jgi:uncharacterized protein (TIGR00251 family)
LPKVKNERKIMALVIEVKVVPRAGSQRWLFDKNGALKCYLKNPAQRGLANEELINLISKVLKIPRTEVILMSGATSRKKMVKINRELSWKDFLYALNIEITDSFLLN